MQKEFASLFGMLSIPFSIGQFVIEWNQTERNLIRLMAMLEEKPPGRISDEAYFAARDKWLDVHYTEWMKHLDKLCAEFKDTDIESDLKSIVGHLPTAIKVRHNVVHGYYGGTFEDGSREFKRKPRKAEHTSDKITVQMIWDWIDQIRALNSVAGKLEIRLKIDGPIRPINSQL
ncbi:hypothetical protein [Croceicoccus gelatinilyticus]|uniref:hypothetical protein n=1 Tax=Croceicoccus gelatinilyticus TaxID=2835536 RepID=UPI001BCF22A5|nr:hypothetical protein [Croceicoccus gelatinilyticus]MBS7670484.1 hypothetical protein [Croceicoccus gelatinilyticus]